MQVSLALAEGKANKSELKNQDLQKKLQEKEKEFNEAHVYWREEINNFQKQASQELNAEQERLVKVSVKESNLN